MQGSPSEYEIFCLRKSEKFLNKLQKKRNFNYSRENIPIKKRNIFQLEKEIGSNQKKENISIRMINFIKRKIEKWQKTKKDV